MTDKKDVCEVYEEDKQAYYVAKCLAKTEEYWFSQKQEGKIY